MVKATAVIKTAIAIMLIAPLTWSCNNKKEDKKEEKTEVKDTTPVVTPAPTTDTNKMMTDTMNQEKPKGEQTPPPKN